MLLFGPLKNWRGNGGVNEIRGVTVIGVGQSDEKVRELCQSYCIIPFYLTI
jgi:hypothetical protein